MEKLRKQISIYVIINKYTDNKLKQEKSNYIHINVNLQIPITIVIEFRQLRIQIHFVTRNFLETSKVIGF